MSLTRPTRMSPDKSSGDYKGYNWKFSRKNQIEDYSTDNKVVIFTTSERQPNPNNQDFLGTPFTFRLGGNSKVRSVQIFIEDMSGEEKYRSEIYELEDGIYPINYKGESVVFTIYVPLRVGTGIYTTIDGGSTSNYKWWVVVNEAVTSAEAYFESREEIGNITVFRDKGTDRELVYNFETDSLTIDSLSHSFSIAYHPDAIPISNFQWKLSNTEGDLVYDTGVIYSPVVRLDYTGFLPQDYVLTLIVQTSYSFKKEIIIPLRYEGAGIQEALRPQLQVTNLPLEACMHIEWDPDEVGPDLNEIDFFDFIAGYEIYRLEKGKQQLKHIFSASGQATEFYDYTVANGREYSYYLYPVIYSQDLEERYRVANAYVTTYKTVNGNKIQLFNRASFTGWVLSVLSPNEGQKNGIYRMAKQFTWIANTSAREIRNNTNIVINEGYGRYPRIQRSRSNYLTVNLQGLIGYFDCESNEYIDNQKMINDLRELTTSNSTMVLRSPKGDIMNVVPTTELSYNFNENLDEYPTEFTLSFTEVGGVDNISVVNKVAGFEWMFTSSGVHSVGVHSTNLAGRELEKEKILTGSNVTVE